MKRILLFGIFSIGSLCVCAQTMIREMIEANTRFIPGAYMKDGKAAIYFSSDEYGYDEGTTKNAALILDFDLNLLNTFLFDVLKPCIVTEKREITGTKDVTKAVEEFGGYFTPETSLSDMEHRRDAFILWYYENNKDYNPALSIESLAASSIIEGTTIIISIPDNYYAPYPEYLKLKQVCLNADDTWRYRYTYGTTVPVCDGHWETLTWYDTPITNLCTPRCTDVANLNDWNGGVYLPFSQTFFNDDDKFEYVRFIAGVDEDGENDITDSENHLGGMSALFNVTASDRDGDGEIDYKRTRYDVYRAGLEVVTEDGEQIYSFPLPDYVDNNAHVEFYKSDNSILAQVSFNWYNKDNVCEHRTRFYHIDKVSGIAKIIHEETSMSAYPNPISSGTPVELRLPKSENERVVSVYTLNGENVYSDKIGKGVDKVLIPTSGLSQGMYLFTLYEKGVKTDAIKIIIR